MIRNDSDIKHALAHLEIGEPAVVATIEQRRYGALALNGFFAALRTGHREALSTYRNGLGPEVIGYDESDELDHHGNFGVFAGRMALRESGIAIVEKYLHSGTPTELKAAMQSSLVNAVGRLRS